MLKKIVMLAFSVLGLVIAGCGSSPCDRLAERTEDAFTGACDGETCAYCVCRRMGLAVNGAGECYELEPTTIEECTDAEQDEAQACLDSPTCLQQIDDAAQASIDAICP
jgi:hypothetical protein